MMIKMTKIVCEALCWKDPTIAIRARTEILSRRHSSRIWLSNIYYHAVLSDFLLIVIYTYIDLRFLQPPVWQPPFICLWFQKPLDMMDLSFHHRSFHRCLSPNLKIFPHLSLSPVFCLKPLHSLPDWLGFGSVPDHQRAESLYPWI